MSIFTRFVTMLAGLSLLVALAVTPVFAHSRYERSEPEAGATVDAAPAEVKVWFANELAEGSWLRAEDASGNRVDTGDGGIDTSDPDRKTMTVALGGDMGAGIYTVKYHSVSADGAILEGAFRFGVGVPVPADQARVEEVEMDEQGQPMAEHQEGEEAEAGEGSGAAHQEGDAPEAAEHVGDMEEQGAGGAGPGKLPAAGDDPTPSLLIPLLAAAALLAGGISLRSRARA
jgi:methionine-rich copper-binding protein CopC